MTQKGCFNCGTMSHKKVVNLFFLSMCRNNTRHTFDFGSNFYGTTCLHKHNWSLLCPSQKEIDVHFVCFLRFHGIFDTLRSFSARDSDIVNCKTWKEGTDHTTAPANHTCYSTVTRKKEHGIITVGLLLPIEPSKNPHQST